MFTYFAYVSPGAGIAPVQQVQSYAPAPMDHAPAPIQAPVPRTTAQFRQWNTEQVEKWTKNSKVDRYGPLNFACISYCYQLPCESISRSLSVLGDLYNLCNITATLLSICQ